MSKVIRIDTETFSRLQNLAEPFVDTPSSVIVRLLDYYEGREEQLGRIIINSTDTRTKHPKQNLFLAPASDVNLKRTIACSVSLTAIKPFLTTDQIGRLQKNSTGLFCWAMTESNRAKYYEMKVGDVVIFSKKDTGRFQFFGRVSAKIENEDLGNRLWPDFVPNKPWKLIYFLEDIERVSIDKTKLVTTIGYDKKFVVPGVTRVNQVARDTILSKHGSMEDFINSLRAKNQSEPNAEA